MQAQDATWWESWIREQSDHERDLYLRHEDRARLLAGTCLATVALGIAFLDLWAPQGGWFGPMLALGGLLVLSAAGWLFWLVHTPMHRSQFPAGSAAGWIHREWVQRDGRYGAGQLGTRLRRITGDTPVAEHAEGRRLLTDWLADYAGTDLSDWLCAPTKAIPVARVEQRAMLSTQLWTLHQTAQAKAGMLNLAMGCATAGASLILASVVWTWSWTELVSGLLVAAIVLGWAISNHKPS
jgi:hypothetical protein